MDKWQIEGKVDYVVASEPFISKEATAGFFKVYKLKDLGIKVYTLAK